MMTDRERRAQTARRLVVQYGGEQYRTAAREGRLWSATAGEAIECLFMAERMGRNPDLFPGETIAAVETEDVDAALDLLTVERATVDLHTLQLIELARGRGRTWEEVGAALGISADRRTAQRFYTLLRERLAKQGLLITGPSSDAGRAQ